MKTLWSMIRALACLFLTAALVGCSSEAPRYERMDGVTVRSTKWGNKREYAAMVVEYDDGSIKTLERVCQDTLPVWAGAKFNLRFHWVGNDSECYVIDSVQRVTP